MSVNLRIGRGLAVKLAAGQELAYTDRRVLELAAKRAVAAPPPGLLRRMVAMLLPVALLLVLAGCGLTPLQQMNVAGEVGDKLWKRAHPVLTARAKAEAKKCAAVASQPVKLEACPGAAKPRKALAGIKVALDSLDAAIIVGAPLALKGRKTADTWVKVALDALAKAQGIAAGAGLLPGGAQ